MKSKFTRFKAGPDLHAQVTAGRLNEILEALEARTPAPGKGTRLRETGKSFSYSASPGDAVAQTRLGFTVSRANASGVKVSPSIVSGASVVAKMPTINGTRLDATTAPVLDLTASVEGFVCLKITIEPESELSGDGVTYKVKDGAGLVVGDIGVEIIGSAEAMEDASELATVDSESGDTATRGVFYVPLAKQESGGRIRNEGYYYGPLGIRLCGSGTLQVIGPIVVLAAEQ